MTARSTDPDPSTSTSPATGTPARKSKRLRIVAAAVVLLAIAAGAFIWWFLRDDAPDEVSISDAVAQVDDATDAAPIESAPATEPTEPTVVGTDAPATPATSTGPSDTSSAAPAGDVDGTWSVDTSIGEFSYEDSTGTFVGFRIAEELQGIGSTTAVGRTPEVSGTLEIDGTTVTAVAIEADMGSITTNDNRRDDKVWSALETDEFPTASFVLTEPIELGDGAMGGDALSVDAVGELTIHGVTTPVTFPLQAQLVDETVVVVGQIDIVFADYGVTVPSAPIIISVEDEGVVELQLFFTR